MRFSPDNWANIRAAAAYLKLPPERFVAGCCSWVISTMLKAELAAGKRELADRLINGHMSGSPQRQRTEPARQAQTVAPPERTGDHLTHRPFAGLKGTT